MVRKITTKPTEYDATAFWLVRLLLPIGKRCALRRRAAVRLV